MIIPGQTISHQALQHGIPAGQDGLVVHALLKPGHASAIANARPTLPGQFPTHRDAGQPLPLLPYAGLHPAFRQLLLDINSSHAIRLIEKALGTSHLLPDATFLQAALCTPQTLPNALATPHNTPHPAGLTPAARCCIVLAGELLAGEQRLQPGDAWLQPSTAPLPQLTGTAGSWFFALFFYQFKSPITHQKVKIR